MIKKLRIVHVGCGEISDSWLKVLSHNSKVEYVAIVDLDEDKAAAQKEKYGLQCDVYDNFKKAILENKPDIVIDNTVPGVHHLVAGYALDHNCHVLSEKPLSDNIENALDVYKKSIEKGKSLIVMQNRRYLPLLSAFKGVNTKEKLGDIASLHAEFFKEAHFGGFRDDMDHPLLMEMAIHTFDQARYILDSNPVSVYCQEYNSKASWYKGNASATCIFEMDDGTIFTYTGSWCATGNQTGWESSWKLMGTKGAATWNGSDNPWYEVKAESENDNRFPEKYDRQTIEAVDMVEVHEGCIRDMLEAVLTGKKAPTDVSDNIYSFAMVMGAIKSAKENRKVTMNELI